MSESAPKRQRARVHHALQRTPMMMGLPQDLVLLGGFFMLTTVVAFQMSPAAIMVCIAVALVAVPLLRRVFAKEPDIQAILPRALGYRKVYPRQAREVADLYQDTVGKRG